MEILKVYRDQAGNPRAVTARNNGGEFTVNFTRGWVSWAEPDVWAFPERFGLTRYTCPGHNGHVCYYGACDEIRIADLPALIRLVSS